MNEDNTSNQKVAESDTTESHSKPGFFQRIFTKLDESMKEKADAKAKDSCCGGDDGKGGKCC